MTKLFQTEIMLFTSLYILADSKEEADAKADALTNGRTSIEFSDRRQEIADGLFMTGESFSPDMPEMSLSPVMTIQSSPTFRCYLSEEFDEEAGDEDDGTSGQDRESYADEQDREGYSA